MHCYQFLKPGSHLFLHPYYQNVILEKIGSKSKTAKNELFFILYVIESMIFNIEASKQHRAPQLWKSITSNTFRIIIVVKSHSFKIVNCNNDLDTGVTFALVFHFTVIASLTRWTFANVSKFQFKSFQISQHNSVQLMSLIKNSR